MSRLEDITPGAALRGLLPDGLVTVVNVDWHGADALTVVYRDAAGRLGNQLVYRDGEDQFEVVTHGRPWSFDGDGAAFRLASEAHRIRLAHLFDPVLAVHTSLVEPLLHQTTAVYEAMLPRQPLRFLLADDPGAGNARCLQVRVVPMAQCRWCAVKVSRAARGGVRMCPTYARHASREPPARPGMSWLWMRQCLVPVRGLEPPTC